MESSIKMTGKLLLLNACFAPFFESNSPFFSNICFFMVSDYPLEGPIKDSKGLTTSEALKRLHDDIKEVLDHEKMKGNFWKLVSKQNKIL